MWTADRFDYLNTLGGRTRYVLAAEHLKGCEHIIELGGFDATIDKFLVHAPKTVTVVDPLIPPEGWTMANGCVVEHVRAMYQTHDYSNITLDGGTKGLLCLGFMLKSGAPSQTTGTLLAGPNDTLHKLTALAEHMDTVILEAQERNTTGFANFELACTMIEGAGFAKALELNLNLVLDEQVAMDHHLFGESQIYRVFKRV